MKPVTSVRDGGRESQGFGSYIGNSIDEVVEASQVNNSGEGTLSCRRGTSTLSREDQSSLPVDETRLWRTVMTINELIYLNYDCVIV